MKSVKVIIETPRGSAEKYTYDKRFGLFALTKILPPGMTFPYDFGFFPDTVGGDGDPADVLVIGEFKSFPGCVMDCRLIGVLLAEQTSKKGMERNDRFFAVPILSRVFKDIRSIKDIPKSEMKAIINFFIVYNLQEGKEFNPLKLVNAHEAVKLFKRS